jgi:hypothetical protein
MSESMRRVSGRCSHRENQLVDVHLAHTLQCLLHGGEAIFVLDELYLLISSQEYTAYNRELYLLAHQGELQ